MHHLLVFSCGESEDVLLPLIISPLLKWSFVVEEFNVYFLATGWLRKGEMLYSH